MALLLDGKLVSEKILDRVAKEVAILKNKGIQPKLAFILVGNNPASLSYIRQKEKACEKTGIAFEHITYEDSITTNDLVKKIETLNLDPTVHGILVQLPLPEHLSTPLIIRAIDPKKDVDGFQAYNLGKMFLSTEFEDLAPCTPLGIIRLLEYYKIPLEGKEVTVVGRSNIVGKPISLMLLNRNATVTTCHSLTRDLAKHTRNADILIVAVGKPGFIKADMVKDGAVVIDVGTTKVENKLRGDVDFETVSKKVSAITPVPGGVGPMTVACLMENVMKASNTRNRMKS